MDEGLLNDLLECSVCLERLDTSSRVLPCQHTFCLKCLKVIVESHKELRCPECRILVEAKVEELPPNVLLMRILEGMKNSAPRKPTGSGHRTKAQLQLAQLQQGQQQMGRADGKQMPPHARALHDYISKEQGDLSFKKGDMIILQKKLDPFWYQGECSGRTGMFPITYVQVIVPLPVPTALCKALYDFRMSAPDEEGCLAFDKGAIITVHRRVDENWAEGRLEQRVGIFPIAFVELNQPARHLMNSAPLNRPVPPLPEHARAGHSDHRHHTQHAHRSQQTSLSLGAAGPGGYQPAMAHSHPAYQQPAHPQQHAHRSQQTSLSLGAAGPGGYQPAMAHSHPAYQQPAHPQQVVVQQPVNQHVISHGLVSREPKHSLDLIHLHLHPHVTRVADAGAGPALGIHAVARVADSCDRLRTKFDPYATSAPIHKIETTYQNVRAHEHFPVNFSALVYPNVHFGPSDERSLNSYVTRVADAGAGPALGIHAVARVADSCDRLRTKFDPYATSAPIHKIETTYQNVRVHEHFPVNFSSNNASSDSSSSMNTPSSFGVSSTTTPNSSSSASACDSAEPSLPSSPDNNACPPTVLPAPEQESSLNTSMGVLSLNESSTATNTSLNVSLPPSESPKLNASTASNASGSATQAVQNQEATENATSEPRLDAPSSSKTVLRSSGPDSLLNFGLGLQAALSPAHKEYAGRARDKRHSLTPAEHLQGSHATQNRHSAEILTTSLLDHVPERDRDSGQRERERERRRRRSRSNERPLPAAYVALYPYKPQKPDELELKKGAVYTVTERCRDGWYKGCGERSARCGVFPGNYVAPAKHSPRLKHDKSTASPVTAVAKPTQAPPPSGSLAPPDAPPRAQSPPNANAQPLTYPWSVSPQAQLQQQQNTPRSEKSKEKSKSEKSSISTGVSLMKRLAAMKKCKSPPPSGYSMDNPVFEDGPGTSLMLNLASQHHPVHVRSGSCPSQLLRALPGTERRHKEHAVLCVHEHARSTNNDGPWQSQHRKSQSLDVTAVRRDRHHSQNVKERFRCIVPYPPNSEYELELKVDDIVVVSRKRGDGWYKGTLQRTGRTGLFPASFVQSCPHE